MSPTMIGVGARALAIAILAAGCAGGLDSGQPDSCTVNFTVTPSQPLAGPDDIRVTANVTGSVGVESYAWAVRRSGAVVPFQNAQANGSAITFVGATPGIYDISVDVDDALAGCSQALMLNVADPSATDLDVRLHVIPPAGIAAPPTDRRIRIPGGANYAMGAVVLDPGIQVTGQVSSGAMAVAAYVKLAPVGMEGAVVEAFAGSNGAFSVRVLDADHTALVIPSDPSFAPVRVAWSPTASTIEVNAGAAITGIVRHGGVAVASAKVQLMIDGVPSTLGTTAGDGTFTVRGTLAIGRPVQVVVTPPAASGLPRLEATATYDLSAVVTINYATTTVRDVATTQVQRAAAPVAGARVTLVGTRNAAGTITTGGTTAAAIGSVRRAVIAAADGRLPSAVIPAWSLDAVIEVPQPPGAPPDLAVAGFNATTAVPTTVTAAAMIPADVAATAAVALAGVRLTLVPTGAMALAGTTSTEFLGNEQGVVSARFATGGTYDLVFNDPAGRAGQRIVTDVTGSSAASSYALPPALRVVGTLSVTGSPNKLAGASVQILCASATCIGLDRDRPIAEGVSTSDGGFDLAVPDLAPM